MIKDLFHDEIDKIPVAAFHTLTLCENIITIYGGMTEKDTISGDLNFIKLGGKTIINSSYEKNKSMFPKPRHSHTADYDVLQKRLFIFGGYSQEQPHLLNQLCILEMKNFPTIIFQSIKTINVTPRCRHSSFLIKGNLYIYGGYGIDKVTKKIQILNDFYNMELESGKIVEVTSKGGAEMAGNLYKITHLENDDFVFFGEDLSKFFVFNHERETFTRIDIKFYIPSPRDFFTINKLSDGRLILIGGSKEDEVFKDVHYLINYTYDQKVFWMWSRMDVFGQVDLGYNAHQALVLQNNHILIHGGTSRSFNCLDTEAVKHEPGFIRKLQVFDIFSSYEWLRNTEEEYSQDISISKNNISASNNNITGTMVEKVDNSYHHISKTLKNSLNHIMAYIPKEINGEYAQLFIHGGENDDKILCSYHIYNLNENKWVHTKKEEDYMLIPQLKGHACTHFYSVIQGGAGSNNLNHSKTKDHYILITGGITIEHGGNVCKVVNAELEKKKVSNLTRSMCSCNNETISETIYAYQQNTFGKIKVNIEEGESLDTLKRYGHNMAYINENNKNEIYMLNGFIQYQGYVFDLIKIELKKDEDLYKRNKNNKDKEFGFTATIKYINIEADIKSRMNAAVAVTNNHIIIFGGTYDDEVLNDLVIINMFDIEKPIANIITHDKKIIAPRFGMSGVIYLDENNEDVSRLIIFGGSTQTEDKMISNMTNELLVFQFRYNSNEHIFNVENYKPNCYGFSEKRIFHQAVLHESYMHIYGGLNTKFQVLSIPSSVSYNIEVSLYEYESSNPPITFDDWENGISSKNKERKNFKKLLNTMNTSNNNNLTRTQNQDNSYNNINNTTYNKDQTLNLNLTANNSKILPEIRNNKVTVTPFDEESDEDNRSGGSDNSYEKINKKDKSLEKILSEGDEEEENQSRRSKEKLINEKSVGEKSSLINNKDATDKSIKSGFTDKVSRTGSKISARTGKSKISANFGNKNKNTIEINRPNLGGNNISKITPEPYDNDTSNMNSSNINLLLGEKNVLLEEDNLISLKNKNNLIEGKSNDKNEEKSFVSTSQTRKGKFVVKKKKQNNWDEDYD